MILKMSYVDGVELWTSCILLNFPCFLENAGISIKMQPFPSKCAHFTKTKVSEIGSWASKVFLLRKTNNMGQYCCKDSYKHLANQAFQCLTFIRNFDLSYIQVQYINCVVYWTDIMLPLQPKLAWSLSVSTGARFHRNYVSSFATKS